MVLKLFTPFSLRLAAIPALAGLALCLSMAPAYAQEAEEDDSTIIYSVEYFAEFSPVSANDMINRIPGIGLAMRRGGGGGRGLGSGEGEILINGQRITGKNNSGQSQLSRISADQVQQIEIIRGTSDDIDVRGGGQVINVVLLDSPSRSSTALEVNTDYINDGTFDPGAKLSYSGQTGNFNYLFHVEAEPRYNFSETDEQSYDPAFVLQETRDEQHTWKQKEYQTSMNLGYQFEQSTVQFNALYEFSDPEQNTDRTINDIINGSSAGQREQGINERNNWEVGGDYEYNFDNDGTYRFLFIVNDREFQSTRERFDISANTETKNRFLSSIGRDRERIARTSYNWDLLSNQGLELGIERAQTIRDSNLKLGLDIDGTPSADFGDLVPVAINNSGSTVEEIRYETFAVHNWQLNDRMTLESSIVVENSSIEQSGDVSNKRNFEFVRPKVDYRFDITPSLQLRATVEKDVSQLSFSDFSASVDSSDEDENTQAGNPEIVQEQNWRYGLNLEYRLPQDIGVLNSSFFYRDFEDIIDRVDVSPSPSNLQSARGNIGDGKRYGVNLDASIRLGFLGVPNALLTTGLGVGDSEVTDPFLNTQRRMRRNGRWFGRAGFRHDVTEHSLNYGFNYSANANDGDGQLQIDIFDIERSKSGPNLSTFIEKQAFGDVTFRLEASNLLDRQNCRTRTRFVGATADGIIEEIEDNCNASGIKMALKVRTTF